MEQPTESRLYPVSHVLGTLVESTSKPTAEPNPESIPWRRIGIGFVTRQPKVSTRAMKSTRTSQS